VAQGPVVQCAVAQRCVTDSGTLTGAVGLAPATLLVDLVGPAVVLGLARAG